MNLGLNGVIGQSAVKNLLAGSIRSGRVSHAYIFEGDIGMGKKTLAYAFARELVCENKSSCGTCKHCLLSAAGNHPDIITVLPAEDKKSISVDSVRELYSSVMVKPFSADKKVIIIPDCEKMTVQSQNALLKMLEEPPSYIVFVLLTSNSNFFLETVLSRSIKLSFSPYTDDEIREILKLAGFSKVPDAVITCADGNGGKALALMSNSDFMELRKQLAEKFQLFFNKKSDLFEIINFMENNKPLAKDMFDILLGFARDLVFCHLSETENIYGEDFIPENYMSRTTLKGCMAFLNNIIDSKKMLLSNVNYSLLVNSFVLSSKEVLVW